MDASPLVNASPLPRIPTGLSEDTVDWARAFIARPARTIADLRHQQIVARLLDELEGWCPYS
jgi:hypothetical protein